jgi:hypothetical protein
MKPDGLISVWDQKAFIVTARANFLAQNNLLAYQRIAVMGGSQKVDHPDPALFTMDTTPFYSGAGMKSSGI